MSTAIQLRLRHPNGDIGPFEVAESLTVQQVKETTFTQWPQGESGSAKVRAVQCPRASSELSPLPAEGPLSKENPTSAADLRILCAGKFLDNTKTLKGAHAAPLVARAAHCAACCIVPRACLVCALCLRVCMRVLCLRVCCMCALCNNLSQASVFNFLWHASTPLRRIPERNGGA